jgi:hypothetical protein
VSPCQDASAPGRILAHGYGVSPPTTRMDGRVSDGAGVGAAMASLGSPLSITS